MGDPCPVTELGFQPSAELTRLANAYGNQLKSISTFVRLQSGGRGLKYFLKTQVQLIYDLEASLDD
jgi:hypothetical protein